MIRFLLIVWLISRIARRRAWRRWSRSFHSWNYRRPPFGPGAHGFGNPDGPWGGWW